MEMKEKLNSKIKFREAFRPFAPSVTEERADEFFEIPEPQRHWPARFMLYVAPVREEKRADLPAITHEDGSGRLQTVYRQTNPAYHRIIERFGELTGVPVIMNTSFNLKGEPIVESPAHAFNTFSLWDGHLFANNFVVEADAKKIADTVFHLRHDGDSVTDGELSDEGPQRPARALRQRPSPSACSRWAAPARLRPARDQHGVRRRVRLARDARPQHRALLLEFDLTLSIDALGLRDDFQSADAVAKETASPRALPRGLLRQRLHGRARGPLRRSPRGRVRRRGRSIEIVNAGVQGYSTDQQLLWLRRHGSALTPDLIVVFPYERHLVECQRAVSTSPSPSSGTTAPWSRATSLWLAGPQPLGKTATANLARPGRTDRRVDGAAVPVDDPRLVATPRRLSPPSSAPPGSWQPWPRKRRARRPFVVCRSVRAHVEARGADERVDPARPHRVLSDAATSLDAGAIDIAGPLRTAHENGHAYYRHDAT